MNKLPKYFAIKQDATNPLWDKYIKWLNKTYKTLWGGDFPDAFYGYDDNVYNTSGTHFALSIENFENNPTILTLEEWDEMVNGFVLPEKWIVKVTEENKDLLNHYRINIKKYSRFGIEFPYMANCGSGDSGESLFYTEITFEQFKKYVLKEEFILPKKWCIRITEENQDILREWRGHYGEVGGYLHVPVEADSILLNSEWDSSIMNGYVEITFEQFKDYVLKQENIMKKEFIGYKLTKPEYNRAAGRIAYQFDTDIETNEDGLCEFMKNSVAYDRLKEAGVLNLWFEPVYEEEFKVGDWVVVLPKDKYYHNAEQGQAQLLVKILERDLLPYVLKFRNGKDNSYTNIRKATPEEIKRATKVLLFKKENHSLYYNPTTKEVITSEGHGTHITQAITCLKNLLSTYSIFNHSLNAELFRIGCLTVTKKELQEIKDKLDKLV
jgi:hypothetical protein